VLHLTPIIDLKRIKDIDRPNLRYSIMQTIQKINTNYYNAITCSVWDVYDGGIWPVAHCCWMNGRKVIDKINKQPKVYLM